MGLTTILPRRSTNSTTPSSQIVLLQSTPSGVTGGLHTLWMETVKSQASAASRQPTDNPKLDTSRELVYFLGTEGLVCSDGSSGFVKLSQDVLECPRSLQTPQTIRRQRTT